MNGFGKGRVDFFEDDFEKLIIKMGIMNRKLFWGIQCLIAQLQKSKQANLLNWLGWHWCRVSSRKECVGKM